MYDGDTLEGFALCHSAPLVEGRTREELRVLKAVVRDESAFDRMLGLLADLARRAETARVAIRLQGDYSSLFRHARRGWRTRALDRPADGAGGVRGAAAEVRRGAIELGDLNGRQTADGRISAGRNLPAISRPPSADGSQSFLRRSSHDDPPYQQKYARRQQQMHISRRLELERGDCPHHEHGERCDDPEIHLALPLQWRD